MSVPRSENTFDEDLTISELPLVSRPERYRQLAEDAAQQANETTGKAREAYLVLAQKGLRRAKESEQALARQMSPTDRRKDYGLRQMIEEYRRIAAQAEERARCAKSAELRDELLAGAASWNSLAEELTGRSPNGRTSR